MAVKNLKSPHSIVWITEDMAMEPTLYVIASCDRCRAAIRWLRAEGRPFLIHDIRQDGLDPQRLDAWLEHFGHEKLLNRNSTTWRNLDDHEKSAINQEAIRSLLLRYPTLIKRPILESSRGLTLGFDPIDYGRYL